MISHPTVQLVFFHLHLILHVCAARFDVTVTAQKFLDFGEHLNGALEKISKTDELKNTEKWGMDHRNRDIGTNTR